MKISYKTSAFTYTAFVLALFIIGCASSGIQRSEKATISMQTMDDYIKLVINQLDATDSSLVDLMKVGQADTRKAFELYKENVSKVEKLENGFANKADEMKDRGNEYFEEWQKEGNTFKNLRIQQLSEQRRNDLSEIYGMIAQSSYGVKDLFKQYLSNCKEIQLFLSNDLTSKGIQSITPTTQKVVYDGTNLKYSLMSIQSAINKARTEMAQAGN